MGDGLQGPAADGRSLGFGADFAAHPPRRGGKKVELALYRAASLLAAFGLIGWGFGRFRPPVTQNDFPHWIPLTALLLALGAPSVIAAWVLISLVQAQEKKLHSGRWLISWGLCLAAPVTYFGSADFDTILLLQNLPLWGVLPAWGALIHPIAFVLSLFSLAQWANEERVDLFPRSTRGLTLCVLLSVETAVFLGGGGIPGGESASAPFLWFSFALKLGALAFAISRLRRPWPAWQMAAAASLNLLATWIFTLKGWVW